MYHLRLGGRETEAEIFAGPFYGFHKRLFQMRVAGTRIIFDAAASEIETTYELSHL